jgi:Fur family transcriptional regulator, peroxide stress response regulator
MAVNKTGTELKVSEPQLTRARRVVLETVSASRNHPTASQIFTAARRRLPGVSYATVYNSLGYLKRAGLVREITFAKAASCYDGRISRHDHAVCSRCGSLVDFELPEIVKFMPKAARHARFKPESIHLTLVGLCPKCAQE